MRIFMVIMTALLMQVSASTKAQQLTLKGANLSLKQFFNQISKQTGYTVLYKSELINNEKAVTVNLENVALEEALKSILAGRNLEYTIKNKAIFISEKEKSIIDRVVDYFLSIEVTGKIVDENGQPIPGANIKVKGTTNVSSSNADGVFTLKNVEEGATLEITIIGYEPKELKAAKNLGNIRLNLFVGKLDEVNVVSTGYQQLPKERATGSFTLVDSALINRRVGANILDRLEGVTNGVTFNRGIRTVANTPEISVRGRSTISSNPNPLIILDNFPYDGDLANINPADVKSISILKDAAAASIWGSRAGNGVIVITTHKGAFNQNTVVSFNANVNIGGKPDLYYQPRITNRQFIDAEQLLFNRGLFTATINNGFAALSPAVEIMRKYPNPADAAIKAAKLDSLAQHDVRDDLNKYYYQNTIAQQYQLSVRGGGTNNKYSVSLGYDKNRSNVISTSNDRLTLNANNTIVFAKNKLELTTGVMFTVNGAQSGSTFTPYTPYDNIADENGNPLPIARNLRFSYIDTAGKGKLLDWYYRPLDEARNSYSKDKTSLTDYRVSLGLNYNIISGLKLGINYSYNKGIGDNETYHSFKSWTLRDNINQYTQIHSVTGAVTYQVPFGEQLNPNVRQYYAHYGRGILSYDRSFNKFSVSAIGGYEIKDYQSKANGITYYGYNKETGQNANSTINPLAVITSIYGTGSTRLNPNAFSSATTDRYRSLFFNGSIAYDDRYIISGSVRRDESNLFGVATNQKGVPLWSAGLAWNISNEAFYHVDLIPSLKLRATYGYSGNVNKALSAYLTGAPFTTSSAWAQPYINITNPPNPSLRWEQVKTINLGLDFQSKNNIISGSVEYWTKEGIDLFGTSPIAPQTGVTTFTGNTANMLGKGIDVMINSQNLKINDFRWNTSFNFNYNTDKITDYKVQNQTNGNIISGNYIQPRIGYSYYSIFALQWRGLDAAGNPQSVLNGITSKDYSGIFNSNNSSELIYSGTATPKYYGNLMNNFSWKSFDLSFNLVYRLGYVFRRPSLIGSNIYSTVYGPTTRYLMPDYDLRWQKAGDELTTNVPSLVYPTVGLRDDTYLNSEILIEKADHIRLQDVRFSYTLSRKTTKKLPFTNLSVYTYISNLGILWKATKYDIDPDYRWSSIPPAKMFAFGLKADF